ncbi:MAG: NAD-dependent protein deacylase [Deltaproteobacteria bacterium]|nr:NAD-dependent protein deacylase [Candidatus Anaeroferrophillacea bacterium]
MDAAIGRAVEILTAAQRPAALTGAGISVSSGIPAFRGAQGLWERYDPEEYAHIDGFRAAPEKVWKMLGEMYTVIDGAVPTAAHLALADMEAAGRLGGVITANVDGLHQAAGSRRVIEFHGSFRTLVCLECGRHYNPVAGVLPPAGIPRCESCDIVLKPDVVLFGETIPVRAQEEALALAAAADVMLVIGTSAVVYPVSDLPLITARHGGRIIEINLEATDLSRVAAVSLCAPADEVLPEIARRVMDRSNPLCGR